MPAVTVRNLPAATHRALKARAAAHGRSTEAEIREILQAAVTPPLQLGTELARIGKRLGGLEIVPLRGRGVRAADFS